MTTILRPAQHFGPLDGLPLLGALAVTLSLSSSYGIRALVRWPNDVVCLGRKLAGTLVEAKFSGNTSTYALLGIGVNVNFQASEIVDEDESATTVLDILGHAVDKAELVCAILLEVERLCDKLDSGLSVQILQQLRLHEGSRGSRIIINLEDRRVEGIFDDYETLTKIRMLDSQGNHVPIDTSSVVTVEYLDV
jgi:BirA family biotin operon repressor/biotin-[acetyl-CoA-carboxylase] ligase